MLFFGLDATDMRTCKILTKLVPGLAFTGTHSKIWAYLSPAGTRVPPGCGGARWVVLSDTSLISIKTAHLVVGGMIGQ